MADGPQRVKLSVIHLLQHCNVAILPVVTKDFPSLLGSLVMNFSRDARSALSFISEVRPGPANYLIG